MRRALPHALTLSLAACNVQNVAVDAAASDAFAVDATSIDAGHDAFAIDAGIDASAIDAYSTADATWGACTVGTTLGVCEDVSLCTGMHTTVAGHCPGPTHVECCIPSTTPTSCDPTVMVQPNLGVADEAPGTGGCPSGMLAISALCVDRYEASLVQVNADGSTQEWSPFFTPDGVTVRALSRAGAVPQGYISGTQAAAACSEAGKRLCTDTEWLRACQGSMGFTYPYGNTRMTGVCNDHRAVHPAVERFGTSDSWIYSMLNDACISQLPMSLARTGAYAGCLTEGGANDMMGNLHEWTADPAGTFRGGYYVDTVINGNGCLYVTTAHDVSHHDYSTGFRCCSDL